MVHGVSTTHHRWNEMQQGHKHKEEEEADWPVQIGGYNPLGSSSSSIHDSGQQQQESPLPLGLAIQGVSGADVYSAASTHKKVQALLLLPGLLSLHAPTPPTKNNNNIKTKDSTDTASAADANVGDSNTGSNNRTQRPKPQQQHRNVWGRIQGFQNHTRQNQNDDDPSSSCLNDDSIPSPLVLTTTANGTQDGPRLRWKGRMLDTQSTFVALRIRPHVPSNNNKNSNSSSHKKSTVVCQGVFRRVIVLGQGQVVVDDGDAPEPTTAAAAAAAAAALMSSSPLVAGVDAATVQSSSSTSTPLLLQPEQQHPQSQPQNWNHYGVSARATKGDAKGKRLNIHAAAATPVTGKREVKILHNKDTNDDDDDGAGEENSSPARTTTHYNTADGGGDDDTMAAAPSLGLPRRSSSRKRSIRRSNETLHDTPTSKQDDGLDEDYRNSDAPSNDGAENDGHDEDDDDEYQPPPPPASTTHRTRTIASRSTRQQSHVSPQKEGLVMPSIEDDPTRDMKFDSLATVKTKSPMQQKLSPRSKSKSETATTTDPPTSDVALGCITDEKQDTAQVTLPQNSDKEEEMDPSNDGSISPTRFSKTDFTIEATVSSSSSITTAAMTKGPPSMATSPSTRGNPSRKRPSEMETVPVSSSQALTTTTTTVTKNAIAVPDEAARRAPVVRMASIVQSHRQQHKESQTKPDPRKTPSVSSSVREERTPTTLPLAATSTPKTALPRRRRRTTPTTSPKEQFGSSANKRRAYAIGNGKVEDEELAFLGGDGE